METVPETLQVVFSAWSAGFGETVFLKFVTLLLGAMLTTGRRTVSQVVRVVGELADADPSSYHRVLSLRRWSMWDLARPLVIGILDAILVKLPGTARPWALPVTSPAHTATNTSSRPM